MISTIGMHWKMIFTVENDFYYRNALENDFYSRNVFDFSYFAFIIFMRGEEVTDFLEGDRSNPTHRDIRVVPVSGN